MSNDRVAVSGEVDAVPWPDDLEAVDESRLFLHGTRTQPVQKPNFPRMHRPLTGRSHFRNHQSMADNLECRNACDHTARGEKPHSKRDPAVWGAKSCHGMMDVIRHAVSGTTLKRHVDNGFCTFENYHEITVFAAWAAPGTFNSVGLLGYIASGFIAETVHPFDNKTFDLSKETAVADMLRWAASLEEA
jgi:hypothetical protein